MKNFLECEDKQLNENEHQVFDSTAPKLQQLIDDLCSDLRFKKLRRSAHIIATSSLEFHHSVVITYRLTGI